MQQADVKTVGVWLRVSTEDQARGDSPEIHRTRAEQYAQFKGWKIAEVYDLSGVSGKAVMEHDETKRMLADIKNGRITGLLFSKLARLARNTKELLEFAEIFRVHDADLISLQESIDTSTPSGRLFYTMIAAMAQWEREEIADRVKASVKTRAKMGKRVAGAAPFGYHWQGGELLPHPDEAPIRTLMYELFVEHQRKGTVARILNERGHRTRRGNKFSIHGMQVLLRDPTAKGLRRSNYTWSEQRGGSVHLKPEDEWEWHECPAVVPVELWERCNAILDEQAKGRRPGRRGTYLFAGKVVCAHDNTKMYVLNESPKFICRECRNKIPQEDVEVIFRDQLNSFFNSEEEIAAYLSSTTDEITAKQEQIRVLSREHETVTADRAKVLRGYLDDKIAIDRFGELDRDAGTRLKEIEKGIAALEGEIAALTVANDSSEEVVSNARDLYGKWDTLPYDAKATIIETITNKIMVGERDVTIDLHYVPFSPKDGNYIQNTFGSFIFFPNASMTFKVRHPEDAEIPDDGLPRLLYKRRRELGLSKRQVAQRLGVCVDMVGKWERGEHEPRVMYMPAIFDFLGEAHEFAGGPLPDRLKRFGTLQGWSKERLGKWLGCSERTVGRIEAGDPPTPRLRGLLVSKKCSEI